MQEDWLPRKRRNERSPGLRLRRPGFGSSSVARCHLFLDLPTPMGKRGGLIRVLPALTFNRIQITFPRDY